MWIITQTICRISTLRPLFVPWSWSVLRGFSHTGTSDSKEFKGCCFAFCWWTGIPQAHCMPCIDILAKLTTGRWLEMRFILAQIISTGVPKSNHPGLLSCHPVKHKWIKWFNSLIRISFTLCRGMVRNYTFDLEMLDKEWVTDHLDKTDIA